MSQSRFNFSANMTLEGYEDLLGKERGTSPDAPVGSDYGSFLGAYLTHHFMNLPAGESAVDFLAKHQAHIKRLVQEQGCVITFHPSKQLPAFFKFLMRNLPLYHALVEAQFLRVDAQCDDGNTFLNQYFRKKKINTPEKAEEAIQLVRASKESLTVANKEGVFPLYAFFNFVYKHGQANILANNEPLINQWKALLDAFALDNPYPMDVSSFSEKCVDYLNMYINVTALTFFDDLLTTATNYGLDLHQPMSGLKGLSLISYRIMNAYKMPSAILRDYYFAMDEKTKGVIFKKDKGFVLKKRPLLFNEKTGFLEGVAGVKGEVLPGFEEYTVFKEKHSYYVFDMAVMAKFFPFEIVNALYFAKNRKIEDHPMLVPAKRDQVNWGLLTHRVLQALVSTCGNDNLTDSGLLNVSIKITDIPAGMRFGLPEKTREGRAVYLGINHKLGISLYYRYFGAYKQLKASDFKQEDEEKFNNFMSLEGGFYNLFDLAIQDKENNYFQLSHYFYQYDTFSSASQQLNLLEFYLSRGSQPDSRDPLSFCHIERVYDRRLSLPKAVIPTNVAVAYESSDGRDWRYDLRDEGEKRTIVESYDMAVLRHLKKIGYSFNSVFVEEEIKRLLQAGSYADPAFYCLMRCFCECGARFPKTIGDQPVSEYIQSRLRALTSQERKQTALDHLDAVSALFNAEPASAGKNMRDYVGLFSMTLPNDYDTAEAMFRDLTSEKGLNQFLMAIDAAFPKVNEMIFDTRLGLSNFVNSIQSDHGNAALMASALTHYLKSDDYNRKLTNEAAYYQLYHGSIIAICNALQLGLVKAMQIKPETQATPEQPEKRSFGGLFRGAQKGFQNVARHLKPGVSATVNEINRLLDRFIRLSPEDANGRRDYLHAYFDLYRYIEEKITEGEVYPQKKIRSKNVRMVLEAFLNGDLLKGHVQLDEAMKQALKVLMPSWARNTPIDSSDEDVEMLKKATAPGSAPEVEESSSTVATTPGDSSDEDVEALIKATAPESAPAEDEPQLPTRKHHSGAGLSVSKSVTMFAEKSHFSEAFLANIEAYKKKIDESFYRNGENHDLLNLISAINQIIETEKVSNPFLDHVICPVTKQVALYPCGLGGELAYGDVLAWANQPYGSTVEGVVVNEEAVVLLSDRELALFFTHLNAMGKLLNLDLNPRSTPTPT